MKSKATIIQKNRPNTPDEINLNRHLDHLCSADEAFFQLQPWTDCISRYGMMVIHKSPTKLIKGYKHIKAMFQVPVNQKIA